MAMIIVGSGGSSCWSRPVASDLSLSLTNSSLLLLLHLNVMDTEIADRKFSMITLFIALLLLISFYSLIRRVTYIILSPPVVVTKYKSLISALDVIKSCCLIHQVTSWRITTSVQTALRLWHHRSKMSNTCLTADCPKSIVSSATEESKTNSTWGWSPIWPSGTRTVSSVRAVEPIWTRTADVDTRMRNPFVNHATRGESDFFMLSPSVLLFWSDPPPDRHPRFAPIRRWWPPTICIPSCVFPLLQLLVSKSSVKDKKRWFLWKRGENVKSVIESEEKGERWWKGEREREDQQCRKWWAVNFAFDTPWRVIKE